MCFVVKYNTTEKENTLFPFKYLAQTTIKIYKEIYNIISIEKAQWLSG